MTSSSSADSQANLPENSKIGRKFRALPWVWHFLCLILLAGSSCVGFWAIAWLTRIPPFPNCEEISSFSADSDLLYCAKTLAESKAPDHLTAAIQLTVDWPETHPLYAETQPLLSSWSKALLDVARQQVHRGRLSMAVQLAERIPDNTPIYANAQASIKGWQAEWERGQAIQTEVQQLIEDRNWRQARETLQGLKQLYTDYWLQHQFRRLQQHIRTEQQAWNQLEQARELASSKQPEGLGAAIALARQIDLQSRAWGEAMGLIDGWSHALLFHSFRRWELGDLDGAISAVQQVPADPTLAPEAQDLIQFSHAQRLASSVTDWRPSLEQIFYLLEAITATQQIPDRSPFYQSAQNNQQNWREQLKDLIQLQMATVVAGLGRKSTYQAAIQQALMITPDRPQRTQAQTLVAHWRKEIERLEDQPHLLRADQLAAGKTIPNLQAAIAEASKVKLGRALRIEGQTRIWNWRNDIQVIEDQPFLDEANRLARQGKFQEAITAANRVQSDRFLYTTAQASINNWTTRMQIAEDSPILREAEKLAAEGSLTAAIDVASQIAPGRALYPDARNSISIWKAEREYIWSIWEAEATAAAAVTSLAESD
ncbi:MAG: hypothetical protein QNJ46_06130 [Leptolyngbyaceae cyanobacterium MO_188.B28]|nr:hypothetical protein [Leptolyngbyaceae cyanobacterium MO_188.B28]